MIGNPTNHLHSDCTAGFMKLLSPRKCMWNKCWFCCPKIPIKGRIEASKTSVFLKPAISIINQVEPKGQFVLLTGGQESDRNIPKGCRYLHYRFQDGGKGQRMHADFRR